MHVLFASVLLSDVVNIQVRTSTALGADMGSGGAIYVYMWNLHGQECGTPFFSGPSGFGLGDTYNTTYCSRFAVPNKVN
jgi:hypothetical protein